VPKESFSSEIGDVHERRGDRPSFTNEFLGASESLIEEHRPPRILDAGRRGRRLMLGIILGCAALTGGGWALWYWSAPIGEWIAGLGRQGDDASAEAPAEAEAPPEAPTPAPQPATPPELGSKIQTTATQVRGKVSDASVANRLAPVDAALPGCWAAAVKAGATQSVNLELSFQIRWSGRANAVAVTGGSEALNKCVRAAVPGGGWPKPSDGGDAKVIRRWTLD
jgi:hypothetical protein